jgi:hypothetical protein
LVAFSRLSASERDGDIDRGIADRRRATLAAGRAPGARRTNGYGGRGLRVAEWPPGGVGPPR